MFYVSCFFQNQCLGKQHCNLTVSSNFTYSYHPRRVFNIAGSDRKEGIILPCSKEDRNLSSSHLCQESLVDRDSVYGNWSTCSSSKNMKLMVYAECKNSQVVLPFHFLHSFVRRHSFSIELESYQIGPLLSLLDASLMVFILIFLLWLEQKETEEISMSTAGICTGGDYTVFTSYLPHHPDMVQLKRQLAKFLEVELSRAPPVFRDGPVEV
jgi:hypothetical protein